MSFIEIYASRNPAAMSLELYLRAGKGTACTIENGELVIRPLEEGKLILPSLRLPYEAGDKLVDALLAAGCRPTKMPPKDETISAMSRHIEFAERMADELLKRSGRAR